MGPGKKHHPEVAASMVEGLRLRAVAHATQELVRLPGFGLPSGRLLPMVPDHLRGSQISTSWGANAPGGSLRAPPDSKRFSASHCL